jgi:hypothetical protein
MVLKNGKVLFVIQIIGIEEKKNGIKKWKSFVCYLDNSKK